MTRLNVYRSCWIRWSRAPFSFKASVLVCGIWLTAPFANGPIVWWQRSEITEKLFTTVTITLRHSPSWFLFSILFGSVIGHNMYKLWWMDLFHHRPDNMENNVYEMWIHATRLRDPGRVQPVIKSRDPPLSKVTLRTRKRLCRGNVSLFLFPSSLDIVICFDWPRPPTHTMLDLISIMTNTTK